MVLVAVPNWAPEQDRSGKYSEHNLADGDELMHICLCFIGRQSATSEAAPPGPSWIFGDIASDEVGLCNM